jgi:hypothetical protein
MKVYKYEFASSRYAFALDLCAEHSTVEQLTKQMHRSGRAKLEETKETDNPLDCDMCHNRERERQMFEFLQQMEEDETAYARAQYDELHKEKENE